MTSFPETTNHNNFDANESFPLFDFNFNNVLINTNISTNTVFYENPTHTDNINATNKSVIIEWDSIKWLLTMYSIIFLLATIGNSLVILTLVQNKRMRTITNVFLLNLAISDLFLGVFCMPFTLVGMILRNFIFGEIMCKLLPYLQASSVAVSSWTLVAISVERYYAICHPLSSRRWQTLSHAYKLIVIIWLSSLLFMLPIAYLSQLIPTRDGHHKCRENWPKNSEKYEQSFNLILDVMLLVIPLLMLGATYSLITRTLWQNMRTESCGSCKGETSATTGQINSSTNVVEVFIKSNGSASSRCPNNGLCESSERKDSRGWHQGWLRASQELNSVPEITKMSGGRHNPALRKSNPEKSLQNKKRVIKMLLLVVLEFFICWTPLYIINTIILFDPILIYQDLGYHAVSVFQLLAYSSSCCNPITYCFMNNGFRKAFLNLFKCFKRFRATSSTANTTARRQQQQHRRTSMSIPAAATTTTTVQTPSNLNGNEGNSKMINRDFMHSHFVAERN
ncbi:cholecystokinin receptor type A-like [Culicoides brevitarsis]|uniref:cholecystokinin receptor type A-like n=1 Tax=Culicoides brevitarsis TaxID=469753 RepID=UPI00307C13F0